MAKHQIFQVPNNHSIDHLEQLLQKELQSEKLEQLDINSPIAERLSKIAAEIESKSNQITNGLLIIGGVVAIANPLIGFGIAAKALLPSLTSKLASNGVDHLSQILKKKKSVEPEANKDAQKDITQLASEI